MAPAFSLLDGSGKKKAGDRPRVLGLSTCFFSLGWSPGGEKDGI